MADLAEEAKDLDATLNSVESVLDLDGMRRRLADLEGEASDPELWNDQERAQQVTSKLSHLRADLTRLEGLRRRVDDLAAAIELGDEELMREVVDDLPALRRDIDALEVRTLLSGDYDGRDAVVTINSGTGGTDAADWAEMLLRMFLRWAERHGYPTVVYDTSYGRSGSPTCRAASLSRVRTSAASCRTVPALSRCCKRSCWSSVAVRKRRRSTSCVARTSPRASVRGRTRCVTTCCTHTNW